MNFNKIEIAEFSRLKESVEKIEYILSFAIHAPSTHNTQPWLFKVVDDTCELKVNKKVLLKEADPDGRNLYISFGCLIENISLISDFFGVNIVVEYLNTNDSIARIKFDFKKQNADRSLDKVVSAILRRATFRGIFTDKKIAVKYYSEVQKINDFNDTELVVISDQTSLKSIAGLVHDSIVKVANYRPFRVELGNWMISNLSRRKDGIPGYAYGFPTLISVLTPRVIKILNPSKMMGAKTKKTFDTAQAVFVIATKEDNKSAWINAGRLSQRVMVHLTANDIKFSISVAPIQDADSLKELKKLLPSKNHPQFMYSVGYADVELRPTPRHELSKLLIK